jgi:hypothetical protein
MRAAASTYLAKRGVPRKSPTAFEFNKKPSSNLDDNAQSVSASVAKGSQVGRSLGTFLKTLSRVADGLTTDTPSRMMGSGYEE